jgi:hypothetical protein
VPVLLTARAVADGGAGVEGLEGGGQADDRAGVDACSLADAHPDRGGTNEEFMAASERYKQALRQAS